MKELRFYFDYISNNAYLAWEQLLPLAKKYDVTVTPVAVLFAGLLEAHGQLGPAEVAPKSRWMVKNCLRKAAALGIPMNPPAYHPYNPLLSLRVSSLPLEAEKRAALVGALFRAVWVRGLHVSEESVVARVADEIGLEGAEIVSAAKTPECKLRLRSATDDAIARGVFGVPSMEVAGEIFWGYDDFPQLERFLAGNDTLDHAKLQEWIAGARSSAVRRR